MQTLARRVTPHVRCPDEGVRAGCRPVPGAWGRTATGREAGTPLGLRPRLHTPYCGQTAGSRLLGAVSMLWGHTSTASRCVTPPHTAAGGTACPPAADSMPRGPRGAPPSSPPGPLPTVGAASRSGPALRGLRPPAHPPHSERGSPSCGPPLLPAHSLPRLHPPQLQRGVQEGRGHTWVTPGATLSTSRGQKPNHRPVGGPPVSVSRPAPPTAHCSAGRRATGPAAGQCGVSDEGRAVPQPACLRGLGDSPGSAADRGPSTRCRRGPG